MRLGAILLIPLALASCKVAEDDSTRDRPAAVQAAADGLCLPAGEVRRLEALQNPPEQDALSLINHYAICHQDSDAARAVATRLADADVPAAIRYLAVVNLNTSHDLDTVVPLLERAVSLGHESSARTLRGLMSSTAVADAFGIERIRPKVRVDVPVRFVRPTAARMIQLCAATDADAQEFCDEAISQVMIETGVCRGQPFAQSVAATRSRVLQAKLGSNQSAINLVRASLDGCTTDANSIPSAALPPAYAPATPAPR